MLSADGSPRIFRFVSIKYSDKILNAAKRFRDPLKNPVAEQLVEKRRPLSGWGCVGRFMCLREDLSAGSFVIADSSLLASPSRTFSSISSSLSRAAFNAIIPWLLRLRDPVAVF